MPAFLILALLSLLFGSAKAQSTSELRLFNQALKPRRRRWGPFFLSVSLHLLICLAVLPVADVFTQEDEDDIYYRRFVAARAIVIRMPSRVSQPSAEDRAPAPGRQLARAHRIEFPMPPAQKPVLKAFDRRFTPPPFWSQSLLPPQQKGPPAAGYPSRVKVIPALQPAPRLELPLQTTTDPATEALLLDMVPAVPSPLKASADALVDPFTGYPVQVFALPSGPANAATALSISGSTPFSGAPGAPNTGSGFTRAADLDNTIDRNPRPHEPLVNLLSMLPMLDVPVRMVHPNNGFFDVVVQSSAADAFPESVGRMTGKPIYTVYLEVGGRKEWIMQYCIPQTNGPARQVSANLVHLGNPAPIKAPFPLITVRPPDELHRESYVLIHGMVDTSGRFQELQVITSAAGHRAERILAYLAQWEFRPATQDGRPVLVEVILAVPPEPA